MIRYSFAIALLCLPIHLFACATCMVGDPTLTVMGTEKNFEGRLRVSTEIMHRGESIGLAGFNQRDVSETRFTLGTSYAFGQDWVFGLQLPVVRKTLENINLSKIDQDGIGDLSLSIKHFSWQDAPTQIRHAAGWLAALRLPTGQEQDGVNGQPLDIDVQPGAGNWVPTLGAWGGYYNYPWFGYVSSSLNYPVGDGYADFEEGVALVSTIQGQYAVTHRLALQLGLDTRWSERHKYNGVADPDSGGFIGFLSPGLVFNLSEDLLLYATVQVPVIDALNGDHEEDTMFRLGLTYDFESH